MEITLFDFGELVAEESYQIYNSKVIYMKYMDMINSKFSITTAIGENIDNIIKYHNVLVDINNCTEKTIMSKVQLPFSVMDICYKEIINYNYKNSKVKNEDSYSFILNGGSTNFELNIDKSNIVFCDIDRKWCEIKDKKRNLIERYDILNDIMINHDYKNNTIHYFNKNGYIIDYLFMYKDDKFKDKSECLSLKYSPSLISFTDNKQLKKVYTLLYDNNGLIKSCRDENKELCKYEQKKDGNIVISITPHLIDNFNYELSQFSGYHLWEANKYIHNGNEDVFIRRIYKLNDIQNERMIKAIKNKDSEISEFDIIK